MSTKLKQVLKVANAWETTGKAFFNRCSNGDLVIHIRDPRLWGGNPNVEHWGNAREIETSIHAVTMRTSGIEIDRQSGCLVFRVYGIYGKAKGE